jgi:hypothetical protein
MFGKNFKKYFFYFFALKKYQNALLKKSLKMKLFFQKLFLNIKVLLFQHNLKQILRMIFSTQFGGQEAISSMILT